MPAGRKNPGRKARARQKVSPGKVAKALGRGEDLKEACLREALGIIERSGVEGLSLRQVSRRLGVSHQAPYKHFPSRDHILAEIVRRAFSAFAAHLEARPRGQDPGEDLGEMGRAYFAYALEHPLQYRLMFGTTLPDPEKHPEMMEEAQRAFALLRQGIAQLPERPERPGLDPGIDFDALFVWSTIHGLSSILQSHAVETLDISREILMEAIPQALLRIGVALGKGEESGSGDGDSENGHGSHPGPEPKD